MTFLDEMKPFHIERVKRQLSDTLQHKIDHKTKPVGALGMLEQLALQIGLIQQTVTPVLSKPAIVVFAGDHGIAMEGVSAYPQEVTYQMVMNFLNKGAAINVFCAQNGIGLKVVDAGVNYDFPEHSELINAKIRKGTRNCATEPAITAAERDRAIEKGAKICAAIHGQGSNIIGFGEMGIGNTSAASLIMSKICKIAIENCTGRGTGVRDEQLGRKIAILRKVASHHSISDPLDVLCAFGGYEMAMMCGAMMKAAEQKMIIMIDGFIATAVFLIAHTLYPAIIDFAIFCHQSDEKGHAGMLRYLNARPLLRLDMRLGEGVGCALAYPIIKLSVAFLNSMASFDAAGVSEKK